jgi:hypothetical protein
MAVFSFVDIDIQEIVIPSECLGDARVQLLVGGLWPLVAVALLQLVLLVGDVAVAVWHKASLRSARVWKAGLLRGLPFSIFLSYCVLPSASRSTFQTWACESFGTSDDTLATAAYMRSDYSVACDAGTHSIRITAAVSVVTLSCLASQVASTTRCRPSPSSSSSFGQWGLRGGSEGGRLRVQWAVLERTGEGGGRVPITL